MEHAQVYLCDSNYGDGGRQHMGNAYNRSGDMFKGYYI